MDLSKLSTTTSSDLALVSWSLLKNKQLSAMSALKAQIAQIEDEYSTIFDKIIENHVAENILPVLNKCRAKLGDFTERDGYITMKTLYPKYPSKRKEGYVLENKFSFNFHSMKLAATESDEDSEDIDYEEYGALDEEVACYLHGIFWQLKSLRNIEITDEALILLMRKRNELTIQYNSISATITEKKMNEHFDNFRISLTIANLQQNVELKELFTNIESNVLALPHTTIVK